MGKEPWEGFALSAGLLDRPFAECGAIVRPRGSRSKDRDYRQSLW